MPNKASPVSQTFPNSSYSHHLSHSNRPHHSYSIKKKANPTNACQSLMLSNHSPTHLPSHKPSFPLPFVNHYLSFPPLIPPPSSTHLVSCPIHPLTLPSICWPIHLWIYLPILPPSINISTLSIPLPTHSTIFPPGTHLPSYPSPIHPLIQSLIYSSVFRLAIV